MLKCICALANYTVNNKRVSCSRGGGYANQKLDFSWLQLLLYNLRIMWKRYSSRNSDRIPFLRPQIKEIEGNFQLCVFDVMHFGLQEILVLVLRLSLCLLVL